MTYTIITVNYNNKEGLEATIKSVLCQTCKDYEYIVVDGGSTDGSVDVIQKYASHLGYWISEPDNGIYQAMNKGIVKAKGEYLNFMNSGDCYYDDQVLSTMSSQLRADIVEGNLYRQDTKSIALRPYKNPTLRNFVEGSLNHQACFIKRSLFNECLYDESLRICADWKFFLERLIFDNCSYLQSETFIANYEGAGLSACSPQHAIERKKVLQSLLPQRILSDYERYMGIESPMIDLIPRFNKTYRLHLLIVAVVRLILTIFRK